ncbi:hypothetical protein NLO95_12850, partial [Pseudomonas syringae]|nr:hypothetical protein [Pseudomonas syringae]
PHCSRFGLSVDEYIACAGAIASNVDRHPGHSYSKKHSKSDSYILFDRSEFIREGADESAASLSSGIALSRMNWVPHVLREFRKLRVV